MLGIFGYPYDQMYRIGMAFPNLGQHFSILPVWETQPEWV